MNNKAPKEPKDNRQRNQRRKLIKKMKRQKRKALQQKQTELKQLENGKMFQEMKVDDSSPQSVPVSVQKPVPEQKINFLEINRFNYLFIYQLGKFYRVKGTNEQNLPININTVYDCDQLVINGKNSNSYANNQNFIFHVQRTGNMSVKPGHILDQMQEQFHQQISNFIHNLDSHKQTVIQTNCHIVFQQCNQPWKDIPSCIEDNDSLMIIGSKNTGKSTLGQFILNTKGDDCVLLDCDIGKNSCLEGCISLTSGNTSKKIWIGEFTPLNNLQTYLRAVRFLFTYYREHLFTKKLVVNTMGYISGLGQFLLYEIYQIVQPKSVLILKSSQTQRYSNLNSIVQNLRTGNYVQKLYVSKSSISSQPSTSEIFYFENQHCHTKKSFSRFQKMFQCNQEKINNISALLELIRESNCLFSKRQVLKCQSRSKLPIYQQSRHGKADIDGLEVVQYKKVTSDEDVDMRIIVLGKMINDTDPSKSYMNRADDISSGLFQVMGLGYCYNSKVYSKQQCKDMMGVVCEGMDFEKGFYHLNEKQMIEVELKMGRIPFMIAAGGGLGSKGMRNNPSKTS